MLSLAEVGVGVVVPLVPFGRRLLLAVVAEGMMEERQKVQRQRALWIRKLALLSKSLSVALSQLLGAMLWVITKAG
jgi:hypothetical protein